MMLNRRSEAETLLKVIAAATQGASNNRAKNLLDRFNPEAPLNYFNKSIFWAPLLMKEVDNKTQILKNTSDLREDLEDIRILLDEASEISTYRSEKVYLAEQAIRAYEFERRQIEDRLQGIINRIKRAPQELGALVERLRSLEAQSLALADRIARLIKALINLPAEVIQKGRDFFDSVASLAVNIAGAYAALNSGNPELAGGFILNGIADIQRGLGSAQDLLNVKVELENQRDLAQQELARIGSQINQANFEIRQLLSRQTEDAQLQDSLAQTQGMLTTFQMNQDATGLRQLQSISDEALWYMRVSVAEQLYSIRRYLDLRLGRDNSIQPMHPPGGIFDAFSYSHLLSILTDIKRAVLQSPITNVVDWDRAISGESFGEDLKRLSDMKTVSFAITGQPKFLERGRVRSVSALVRDGEGHAVNGYFKMSHAGGRYMFSDSIFFDFDSVDWTFQVKDGIAKNTSEHFAFRGLASNWALQILDAPDRNAASVEWVFEVEVPPTEADLNLEGALEFVEVDRPQKSRRGSAQWLKDQQQRLTSMANLHAKVIGRSLVMSSVYGAKG
jgi:antitoxin component HigA of HigAB toxin-antitoxin module